MSRPPSVVAGATTPPPAPLGEDSGGSPATRSALRNPPPAPLGEGDHRVAMVVGAPIAANAATQKSLSPSRRTPRLSLRGASSARSAPAPQRDQIRNVFRAGRTVLVEVAAAAELMPLAQEDGEVARVHGVRAVEVAVAGDTASVRADGAAEMASLVGAEMIPAAVTARGVVGADGRGARRILAADRVVRVAAVTLDRRTRAGEAGERSDQKERSGESVRPKSESRAGVRRWHGWNRRNAEHRNRAGEPCSPSREVALHPAARNRQRFRSQGIERRSRP
jgi:hypothetical protein